MKTNVLSLNDFVEKAANTENAAFVVQATGVVPPTALSNMRKLHRLGLLTGEVMLSLIGQAPIDPYGIFGALQSYGPWAFQPLNFTALAVLAKKGATPVAAMQVDLLSDDITFVVLKDRQLVTHSTVTGEEMVDRMRQEGTTAASFTAWLRGKMQAVVDAGLAQ